MRYINLTSGNYEITLLTKEEYEKYNEMQRIPIMNRWWWLRSPGSTKLLTACVYSNYHCNTTGGGVEGAILAVRPALKSKVLNLSVGTMFTALGNTWIMIDNGFAISVDAVAHRRYDEGSNVWETSELKAWLEKWARDREESVMRDYSVLAGVMFENVSAESKEQAIEQVKAWLRDGIDTDDGSLGFDVWGVEEE